MAGINKQGNTQRVQKQQVESLIDFRALSRGKSNKVMTKNFTTYLSCCDQTHAALICFLIYESKLNNVVRFNTDLLKRYKAYVSAVNEKFNEVKATRSLAFCRADFQKVIAEGILIPIMPEKKLFLINPALVYDVTCYNQQHWFMGAYEAIYDHYASGGIEKAILNKSMTEIGRMYYNRCLK